MTTPGAFHLTLPAIVLLAACGGTAAPSSTPAKASATGAVASAVSSPSSSASVAASATASGRVQALSQSKLRFALPINSGLQVLPQVALDAGYFKEEGLDTTITMIRGSQEVVAALTNGEIDMANSDSPSTLNAHLSGVHNLILAVPVSKPIFDLMVPASVTKPEDLKGKVVAVSRVCDSTCFQISRALQGWGLKPQQDVKFQGVTDYSGMFAGLKTGQLAGAALAPPFNFQAKNQGFHSLADLSQLPVDYPTAVVQALQPFLNAHPDTTVAFLRAYTKAIQRYKSDEAFMVSVYKKFLQSDDTQVIEDTWSYYRNLLHDDPTPSEDGIKFVLDSLADDGNAKAKTANPADFIAPKFMQQAKTKA